jgi:cell division protein FtsA
VAAAKNIEKCVRRANLSVKDLILEPLASSDAVLTDDEKEAGVVLVDIGGGTTDMAVYYDNIIRHTAVIPLGGNVVTNDIKEGCAILHRHAEQLKIQYGSALGDIAPDDKVVAIPGISGRNPKEISFKSLAYIIQSRMEEIIDFVNFEIQNSGYADRLAAGIVITGGGAMLKHLPQLMQFRTAMDVRVGYPNEHLGGAGREEINQPMYSTSVGLIMRGFDFLETYRKSFNAAPQHEFTEQGGGSFEPASVPGEDQADTAAEPKTSLTEKIKMLMQKMFEVEDNPINQ